MENTTFETDVLILGAGIGGYETFRSLKNEFLKHKIHKKITIVDKNNYFTFAPLLHEVASGAVEPAHATMPLREVVYGTGHEFIKASVTKIEPNTKVVHTDVGTIHYAYCVLALGSTVNFYGVSGANAHAFTVRTLGEAMHLRESLIKKVESCESEISITVVGGGYTGVEVAGQLMHLVQHDFKKLYPHKVVSIGIVQVGPTLVPNLPAEAQHKIQRRLEKMGVQILLNNGVKEVRADSVLLCDDTVRPSHFTVWCAGIGNVADKFLEPTYTEKGRMPVNEFLQSVKEPTLYGVGDIILGHNLHETTPYPQLGEAAHKEGEYVAKHICAQYGSYHIPPFSFRSKATLMPIGDRYGLLVHGNFVMTGLIAWWLRRTVYLMFMPGIIRKLKIVWDWTLRLFSFSYIIDIERKERRPLK